MNKEIFIRLFSGATWLDIFFVLIKYTLILIFIGSGLALSFFRFLFISFFHSIYTFNFSMLAAYISIVIIILLNFLVIAIRIAVYRASISNLTSLKSN